MAEKLTPITPGEVLSEELTEKSMRGGETFLRRYSHLLLVCLLMLLAGGCSPRSISPGRGGEPVAPAADLDLMGYTIQAGAFAHLDNAVRLMQALQAQGLEAYYFRHQSGLFKVRFGDFPSAREARQRAEQLRDAAIIDVFYIVRPEEYAVARQRRYGDGYLRDHLVDTARRFLGIPYKWGGESAREGFDCSGLTMTVYRMNGLSLPRNSRQQYRRGRPVAKGGLRPGDLVFFATNGGRRVSHVGIYLGSGRFIHAPKTGKTIRIASLSSSYFAKRYLGGRTYLRRAVNG